MLQVLKTNPLARAVAAIPRARRGPIGLDLGPERLQLVQMDVVGGTPRMRAMVSLPYPDGRDAVLATGSPYVTALVDTYADPATAPAGTPGDDLIAWKAELATLLPDGRGAIVQDAADPAVVTVTIQWVDRDENRAAAAQVLQFTTMTRL